MDNNRPERTVRGPVTWRYVCLGSGGPNGAKAAGPLLSVMQTAHWAGLNPYRYMLVWLNVCEGNRGQAPADLSPWLPWEIDKRRMEALRPPPHTGGPLPAGRQRHRPPPARPVPRAA
ncbi:MAG: hypothetical protein OXN89_19980 [Bryobacterales bacterium]|nr:hypothetical protein [Bryobacterales bacterium]